jgi:hypothetical protein
MSSIRPLAAPLAAAVLSTSAAGQSRYLELYDSHDWTLEITVNVRAHTTYDPRTRMPDREEFKFDTAAIVFPVLRNSGSHVCNEPVTGEVLGNDRTLGTTFDFLSDYHSGTRLAKFGLKDWRGEEITLKVVIPTTCYKTRFNEEAAMVINWPGGELPADAASTFQPQMFVTLAPGNVPYDMAPVKDLLSRYCNGQDPKKLKPIALAKYIAGQVLEDIQPSGEGLNYGRTGELEGMDLQGAPQTAQRRRGSQFDIICLLAAIYREAGLPARTVIGYDIGEKKDDDRRKFLERKGSAKLRGWVEVGLYDEAAGDGRTIWVPVDVARMRQSGSRSQPLEKPWAYFGTHDELDGVIPIAFQFHPPTTVRAYGSPAFWGWLVTPKPPEYAEQAVRFLAKTTPVTGSPPRGEPPPRPYK